jgi:3'-phosphoadenosine 5'-phosphosulfate sulfotransferase (PAPS reductase)/FAD synthetase
LADPPSVAVDLDSYERIIVFFSGGKDSLACLLHLLDLGVEPGRIELWHHDVDGREGSHLMDWPCTAAYCRAVAMAFGVKLWFSWKAGGFEAEMLRDEAATAAIHFETPDGVQVVGGDSARVGTRLKFPQVSGDLRVRWCSAYLKIDVASRAITSQARFEGSRSLVISGERAEESPQRAKYKEFEPHRTSNTKRHVDHWRPVHAWSAGISLGRSQPALLQKAHQSHWGNLVYTWLQSGTGKRLSLTTTSISLPNRAVQNYRKNLR